MPTMDGIDIDGMGSNLNYMYVQRQIFKNINYVLMMH